jgi:hypothetical protein
MDDLILKQLYELAIAFNKIGIKPVICGGLGIYLTLWDKQSELPLRITYDIDLMLTKQQIFDDVQRQAIAEIITGDLKYTVCEEGKYFMFEKGNLQLDILTSPIDFMEVEGFRAKIIKSRLHGYITPEAQFIEEDMRTISLSELLTNNKDTEDFEVCVPSPTNLLILKLFAFNDRDSGTRQDDNKARAHAYDIYVIVTAANLQDYKEGIKLLSRHSDSKIIYQLKSIVENQFNTIDSSGWLRVLENTIFFPNLGINQKRDKIRQAQDRLKKWFLGG